MPTKRGDFRFTHDCVAKLDGFVDEGRPRILVSPLTRLSREGSCGLDALTATPDATLWNLLPVLGFQ